MKQKQFKVVNGRWQTGNLYDSLTAAKFDFFINLHKSSIKNNKVYCRKFPLYVYNHEFNFKNK